MSAELSDVALLARLVAFDTTSRRPTVEFERFVLDYLDLPGVRVERFPYAEGLTNLLLSVGPECRHGEGLLLAGHIDTVPADEPDWQGDPRALAEHDGRLIGRGACDMKGFDALAINLLREAAAGATLAEPLMLLLTCDEEVGTLGAGAFARTWPRERPLPRRTLIGEPTSMRVIRGHKGHLSLTVTVAGIAAHSGFPHKGVNAIERAGAAIAALAVLRKEMAGLRTAESGLFPEVPFPVLTVARIRGGSAINVVPERCEIDVGVRLLPGMSRDDLVRRLRTAVEAVVPDGAVSVAIGNDTPAFATAEDSPFVREMTALTGSGEATGVGFGTDAGRLATLGLECVIWGPGDISNAHRAGEWMPCAEFAAAATVIRRLVR
jgi:acetylornithine deacetylase